jgi:predicted nucleotidyltransferase component of viral defense system
MDISLDILRIIAGKQGFVLPILEKDYLVTYLLYLIKDVKGMHFKGGTAINKILLDHQRLSEDLDFSLARPVADVEKEIKDILAKTMFNKITSDKKVEGFTRLIVHYKLFHESGTIFIDLNERAKIFLPPKKTKIPHFYKDFIPEFEVSCLQPEELVAEKIMAVCNRYRPRDYFDLYYIVKKRIPLDIEFLKKKFNLSGLEFSVLDIFKNNNKIFNQWNDDLFMLMKEKLDFKEVMTYLSNHFKLKEEKEKLKDKK